MCRTAGLAVGIGLLTLSGVWAQETGEKSGEAGQEAPSEIDPEALAILKKMSDFVRGETYISVLYDTSIEAMTTEGHKIQFNSSSELLLHRPGKIRLSRSGGYAEYEIVYDAQTFTIFDNFHNTYVQEPMTASVDEIVDRVENELKIELPGTDILMSNPYEMLSEGLLKAEHIGRGVIDGIMCEHLMFRYQDIDVQLWVASDKEPIPEKYVITNKTIQAEPQYTFEIRHWRKVDEIPDYSFVFEPPDAAEKILISQLSPIGEIPPESVMGEEDAN